VRYPVFCVGGVCVVGGGSHSPDPGGVWKGQRLLPSLWLRLALWACHEGQLFQQSLVMR